MDEIIIQKNYLSGSWVIEEVKKIKDLVQKNIWKVNIAKHGEIKWRSSNIIKAG